jgi:hypothetical protein
MPERTSCICNLLTKMDCKTVGARILLEAHPDLSSFSPSTCLQLESSSAQHSVVAVSK